MLVVFINLKKLTTKLATKAAFIFHSGRTPIIPKLEAKKIASLFTLTLLIAVIATTVLLTQRNTTPPGTKAQANQAIQITQGQPIQYEASDLLPNTNTTIYVWKTNENPNANDKIGLAGVFLPWENYPEVLDALNKNFGDKIIGTADDVNAQDQMEKHLYMLMTGGVKTIGLGIEWKRVERQKGAWTWDISDSVFNAIKSFYDKYNWRFEPVVMLGTPPRWISSAPKNLGLPFGKYPPKDLWRRSQIPENPDENLAPWGSPSYNNYVEEVVKRYKPNGALFPESEFGIRHWVIWNEANWDFFQNPKNTGRMMPSMKPYAYLLKGSGLRIHETDPEAIVLTSGFADGDYSWAETFEDGSSRSLVNTIQKLYQELTQSPDFGANTGKKSFDIINTHTYKSPSIFASKFNQIVNIRNSYADSHKKIWVTEWGCDASECRTNPDSEIISRWQQGKAAFDSIPEVERHTWWDSRGYILQDEDANAAKYLQPTAGREGIQWTFFSGMMYTSFKPRPVYSQLAKDTGALESEQTLSVTTDKDGNLLAHILGSYFSQPGKYLVFFTQDERINTELPTQITVLPGEGQTSNQVIITDEIKDTYITSLNPSQNNLNDPSLVIRTPNFISSLLKFDVSSIPSTGTIESAKLYFYPYGRSSAKPTTISAYKLLRDWDPKTTTWTKASLSQNWSSPGANSAGSDRSSQAYSSFTTQTLKQEVSLDIANLVQEWVSNPISNNGILLQGTSPDRVSYFFNSNQAGDINKPRVEITYRIGTGVTTPTPTPTPPPVEEGNNYIIKVNARGHVSSGAESPRIKLYANYHKGNTQPLTEWTTSWQNKDYIFNLNTNSVLERIDLVLPNGTGQSNALYINSVSVNDIAIYPNSATCNFDAGSDTRAFDGSNLSNSCPSPAWNNGSYRLTNLPNIPGGGYTTPTPTITTTPSPTPASNQVITINANGIQKGSSEQPKLWLYINYQSGDAATQKWTTTQVNQDFTFTPTESVNRVDVVFPNQNYTDSNNTNFLIVNSVKLGGQQLFVGSADCFYDRGSANETGSVWDSAFDSKSSNSTCQKNMFWNGSLRLTNF